MKNILFGNFLSKFRDVGLLLVRVGLGSMFLIVHGRGKLFGGPETWEGVGAAATRLAGLPTEGMLPTAMGLAAAAAEFFGGLFLIAGLLTRPTALVLAVTMFVAFLTHAIPDGMSKFLSSPYSGAWPFELMFVFLGLMFLGAGRFSLDYMLTKKA